MSSDTALLFCFNIYHFFPGERGKKTSSRLVIANVERSDSGNYSCTTDTALPSTIVVFVSDGE
jgi:hypothetical protein